jgi:hypothetical protein
MRNFGHKKAQKVLNVWPLFDEDAVYGDWIGLAVWTPLWRSLRKVSFPPVGEVGGIRNGRLHFMAHGSNPPPVFDGDQSRGVIR